METKMYFRELKSESARPLVSLQPIKNLILSNVIRNCKLKSII